MMFGGSVREQFLFLGFLCAAAALEVSGDALIRKWTEGGNVLFVILGGALLVGYGIAVNRVRWEMSRQLGLYVCFFVVAAIAWSRFVRHESIPFTTRIGLSIIVAGGLYIQYGPKLHEIMSKLRTA
jgi:drug/metabolite transporter superfamily protein YnfA